VPGIYHFRFLKTLGDMKVWMDIVDDHAAVPLADGSVFAKVSRVTAPVVKSSHSVEQSEHSNGQDSNSRHNYFSMTRTVPTPPQRLVVKLRLHLLQHLRKTLPIC
jgi:hypothetical protein